MSNRAPLLVPQCYTGLDSATQRRTLKAFDSSQAQPIGMQGGDAKCFGSRGAKPCKTNRASNDTLVADTTPQHSGGTTRVHTQTRKNGCRRYGTIRVQSGAHSQRLLQQRVRILAGHSPTRVQRRWQGGGSGSMGQVQDEKQQGGPNQLQQHAIRLLGYASWLGQVRLPQLQSLSPSLGIRGEIFQPGSRSVHCCNSGTGSLQAQHQNNVGNQCRACRFPAAFRCCSLTYALAC